MKKPSGDLRLVFASSVLFSLLAHGYRFLSLSFSGDSMQISMLGETVYQATLGRFLQPVYWAVRGHITAPLVIGAFSVAFLSLAMALIVDLLGVTRPAHVVLACAAMAACETLAISSASYLPWMDVYMLALLFAAMGVYAFFRLRFGFVLSAACYVVSLGLYQSYLPAASTLILLVLLRELLGGARTGDIWRRGVLACLSLLAGLLAYAALLKLVLGALGASASQEYNGVGRVGLISLSHLPGLLRQTYLTPLQVLFSDTPAMTWHKSAIPPALHIVLALVCAAMVLLAGRGLRLGGWLTCAFLVGMLPLGMNFIQFIAKGTASGLTIFAYHFFYLIPLALADLLPLRRGARALRHAACLLLALISLTGVMNANRMAIKRDLEFAATTSAMARLLDRAEQVEGYVPGKTPVVVIGYLTSSAIAMERPGFEEIARMQGMRYMYGASHESSVYWYLRTALGAPVNLVSHEERRALEQTEAARSIPAYPAEGCCQMIDGRLYIRIN